MGLSKTFWSWFGNSWLFPEHLERRFILNAVRDAAQLAHGTLIDVGCGGRPYQSLFAKRVERYIGIDYPTTFSQHMSDVGSTVDVFADAQYLPIRDGSADVVLCTQVLEHVSEPWVAFEGIARILRPEGLLILTVPQEWGLHQEPHDYYRFTRYGLEHLARRSGLEIKYIANRGGFWAMMGQRFSAYLYDDICLWLLDKSKLAFRLAAVVVLPACATVQVLALGADRIQHLATNTLGYILVASKPPS